MEEKKKRRFRLFDIDEHPFATVCIVAIIVDGAVRIVTSIFGKYE